MENKVQYEIVWLLLPTNDCNVDKMSTETQQPGSVFLLCDVVDWKWEHPNFLPHFDHIRCVFP